MSSQVIQRMFGLMLLGLGHGGNEESKAEKQSLATVHIDSFGINPTHDNPPHGPCHSC